MGFAYLAVAFLYISLDGSVDKESTGNVGDTADASSIVGSGRPWRRRWQPRTPVFLPKNVPWTEEPGGLQSIGSQSPTTEATNVYFVLSYYL